MNEKKEDILRNSPRQLTASGLAFGLFIAAIIFGVVIAIIIGNQ